MILFCARDLKEEDLPHRTKLSGLIVQAFKESYKALIDEIGVCA